MAKKKNTNDNSKRKNTGKNNAGTRSLNKEAKVSKRKYESNK